MPFTPEFSHLREGKSADVLTSKDTECDQDVGVDAKLVGSGSCNSALAVGVAVHRVAPTAMVIRLDRRYALIRLLLISGTLFAKGLVLPALLCGSVTVESNPAVTSVIPVRRRRFTYRELYVPGHDIHELAIRRVSDVRRILDHAGVANSHIRPPRPSLEDWKGSL